MSVRRLGEILLDHGWITRADLARALKSQQLVGGRLGTCLLEAEAISEELLGQALAEQLGVPAASIEDLRHVEPDVLALVPKRLAVRCRVVPLHAAGSRLDLATSEPGNLLCQDEIAFATSRRLVVRVASEARIVEALGRYYDERPAGRFVGLVDRLNRQRDAWRAAAAVGGSGGGLAAERELLGRIDEGGGGAGGGEVEAIVDGGAKSSGKKGMEGGWTAGGAVTGTRRPTAGSGTAPAAGGAAPGGAGRGAAATGAAAPGGAAPDSASGEPDGAAGRFTRPSAVALSEAERAALFGAGAGAEAGGIGRTGSAAAEPSSAGRFASAATAPPPAARPAAATSSSPSRSATPSPEAPTPTSPGRSAAPAAEAPASAAPPAPAGPRPVPAPPRREPTTIAVAVVQLGDAVERDEVGRIVVGYLRQLFDRVLLLAVRREGVRGWLGAGDGVDRERLGDLVVPFDRPSVFLNLKQGSPLHLGPLPPMPAHRPLLAVLGGDPPGPCLLLPVPVAAKLAAVIYGDREGAPLGGIDLDGLRRLAEQAGLALERCISLKRKAHSGPAAG